MTDAPEPEITLPASLRFLRVLVTILMIVMILGVVSIVALLWKGYNEARPPLPETITLPDGISASAVTFGRDWYAVVSQDDRILIFDHATGTLRQEVAIAPAASSPATQSKP